MKIKKYLHSNRFHNPHTRRKHVSWYERLSEDAYVGWVVIVSTSFLTALVMIICAGWLFFIISSVYKSDQTVMLFPVILFLTREFG